MVCVVHPLCESTALSLGRVRGSTRLSRIPRGVQVTIKGRPGRISESSAQWGGVHLVVAALRVVEPVVAEQVAVTEYEKEPYHIEKKFPMTIQGLDKNTRQR